MRLLVIGATAAFLLIPAAHPALACGGASLTMAQAEAVDLSAVTQAAADVAVTQATATVDVSAAKKKKEKVEYMKSAAGPEPKMKKHKKHRKHMKHRKHKKSMKKKAM